ISSPVLDSSSVDSQDRSSTFLPKIKRASRMTTVVTTGTLLSLLGFNPAVPTTLLDILGLGLLLTFAVLSIAIFAGEFADAGKYEDYQYDNTYTKRSMEALSPALEMLRKAYDKYEEPSGYQG
ncbi:unnamed protein product, partial [Meganyctiphanes norvegica]